jgi:large subunit ribosomal protein L29
MKVKPRELRGLTEADLLKRLDEAYEELFNLRTRLAIRELDNFAEIRKTRRSIAQIKTVLHEQKLAIRET